MIFTLSLHFLQYHLVHCDTFFLTTALVGYIEIFSRFTSTFPTYFKLKIAHLGIYKKTSLLYPAYLYFPGYFYVIFLYIPLSNTFQDAFGTKTDKNFLYAQIQSLNYYITHLQSILRSYRVLIHLYFVSSKTKRRANI